MSVSEPSVGITEFLSDHLPFRAVLKQSAHDFIVSELTVDRTPARITRLPVFPPLKKTESEEKGPSEPSLAPTEAQFAALDALIPEASAALRPFFPAEGDAQTPPTAKPKSALTPACSDKVARGKVHDWVRNHMPHYLSDTMESAGGQCVRVRPSYTVPMRKRRRSDRDAGTRRSTPAKISAPNSERIGNAPSHAKRPRGEMTIPNDTQLDTLDAILPCASVALRPLFAQSVEPSADGLADGVRLPLCTDKAAEEKVRDWLQEYMPGATCEALESSDGLRMCVRSPHVAPSQQRKRAEEAEGDTGASESAPPSGVGKSKANAVKEEPEGKAPPREPLRVSRQTPVQFVLWKSGFDTSHALSELSYQLRVPVSAFSFAGSKDKRAVTTQLVQVRGVGEAVFARANIRFRNRGTSILTGDVAVAPRNQLALGALVGNRFSLALRDVDKDAEARMPRGIASLRARGFVNYFGLQRFGSGVSPTHETGFALLRGDFADVCRRVLLPVPHEATPGYPVQPEKERTRDTLRRFAAREVSARELIDVLPKYMHIERMVVQSYAADERRQLSSKSEKGDDEDGKEGKAAQVKYDHKAAFSTLPRNTRRIYGHAAQSFLWNLMASARVRRSRPNCDERMHAIAGDLVVTDEDERCGEGGEGSAIEGDKRLTDLNYETAVREVTVEEEEKRSVSVFRVVLPVLGAEVGVPRGLYGEVVREELQKRGVDFKKAVCSEYGLKGTYRRLLAKPNDVQARFVKDVKVGDRLLAEEMAFLRADVRNKEKKSACDALNVPEDGDVTNGNCLVESGKDVDEGRQQAIVLSFSLGSSEYATMLVRELTKQDSSTANQKAMQEVVSGEAA